MRPVAGRGGFVALAAACLVVLLPRVVFAQTPSPAPAEDRRASRLDRLEQWTTAVERHVPGRADDALGTFRGWSSTDLSELTVSVYSTLNLLRNGSSRIFMRPPGSTRRPVQVFYSLGEVRRLLDVSRRFGAIGETGVLRRGALLHMDVIVLGSGVDSASRSRNGTSFLLFQFSDGQLLATVDAAGHWDTGRFLLDRRERPERDDWVRRWYRTATLFMLGTMQLHPGIVARGLELFPSDPELLLLAGAFHETLASPAVQEPLRAADLPRDATPAVRTARTELGLAEDLLRRVAEARPDLDEAHLRLGNVLARLGRHKDALTELRQVTVWKNPLLEYYARLFIGRSAAALGDDAAARAAFDAASRLSPGAQSPLLALSHLAHARGDLDGAAAALARVFALRDPDVSGGDPWWAYAVSAGRVFEISKTDLAAQVGEALPR
jgi:tetratricopeptide (TPR) repeat protein